MARIGICSSNLLILMKMVGIGLDVLVIQWIYPTMGRYWRLVHGDAVFIYELSSIASVYHIHLLDTIYCDDVYEVSVSGDGRAVGTMSSKSSASYAWVLIRVGNGFQQRGSTFTGYGSYYSGIALNYYATIVAIGDDNYDYDGSNDRHDMGRVSVFQWADVYGNGFKNWIQMGSDITGDAANGRLGRYGCVSITYDGLTVAVGAQGPTKRGLVRVYNHNAFSDTWKQSGNDLVGG